jgi:hypothetical protein
MASIARHVSGAREAAAVSRAAEPLTDLERARLRLLPALLALELSVTGVLAAAGWGIYRLFA